MLNKQQKIRFSCSGASHQNGAAERTINMVVTMESAILIQAGMICHKEILYIDFFQRNWTIVYESKVGSLIYSMLYKPLGKFEPYMFWSQGCRILEWKPLNGIQWVKEGLIWALSRLFNTSCVGYEYDEWFKITSVSYYIDDILYSIVRSTSPDTELWIRMVPSTNSSIKVMLYQ